MHTLQQRIAEVVRWRGPLPVTVLAHRLGPADGAAALVRFAHRLECPTTLVHDGPGLDDAAALALVDAGLGRAIIRVGGVDAATHEAVVGSPLDAAQGAIAALLAAREERGARLEVVARVPWRKGVGPDPSDLGVALRQWGVDRWHLAAAYRADAAAPPPQGGQAPATDPPAPASALDALRPRAPRRAPPRTRAPWGAAAARRPPSDSCSPARARLQPPSTHRSPPSRASCPTNGRGRRPPRGHPVLRPGVRHPSGAPRRHGLAAPGRRLEVVMRIVMDAAPLQGTTISADLDGWAARAAEAALDGPTALDVRFRVHGRLPASTGRWRSPSSKPRRSGARFGCGCRGTPTSSSRRWRRPAPKTSTSTPPIST